MSMFNQTVDNFGTSTGSATKEFFASVYAYMFAALAVTGGVAWFASTSEAFLSSMYTSSGFTPLFYIIMFSPLAIAWILQARADKLSIPVMMVLFLAYSVLLGMSLSFIFIIYELGSIAVTFFTTAGAFGAMAVLGYTTKTDLTKMGSLLWMVFFGMFIASMVNWFIGSESISYVVSFLGLIVFTGLTAWQMQSLKNMSAQVTDPTERGKLAMLGGFTLYVLFINLFLSILRFMGDRR